jgi:hypothetical protein
LFFCNYLADRAYGAKDSFFARGSDLLQGGASKKSISAAWDKKIFCSAACILIFT